MSGSHLYILQDLSQESAGAGAGAGAFLTALHTALPGTSPGAALFSTWLSVVFFQLSVVFFQGHVHFFQVAHNSPILSQPVQHHRYGPSAFPRQPIRPLALLGAAPNPSLLAKRSPRSAFSSAPLALALRVTLPLFPLQLSSFTPHPQGSANDSAGMKSGAGGRGDRHHLRSSKSKIFTVWPSQGRLLTSASFLNWKLGGLLSQFYFF